MSITKQLPSIALQVNGSKSSSAVPSTPAATASPAAPNVVPTVQRSITVQRSFDARRSLLVFSLGAAVGVSGWLGLQYLVPAVGSTSEDRTPASDAHGLAEGSPGALVPQGNGTALLVRAYTIPNPNELRAENSSFTGTLEPRYQTQLGFRVPGKIIARYVEVGDRVQQGQLLMQIDSEDLDLQLDVANSDLTVALSQLVQVESEEARIGSLQASQSVSKSDYELALAARDTARARVEAAQRRLMIAKNQRSYCDLTADADGLISQLLVETGQVVSAGQGVMQWVRGNELEAQVSIPETVRHQAHDRDVEITFWSRPGERFVGKLREMSPVADPASRTYDARFQVVDPPAELALGMTATVHLVSQQTLGIPIPMTAVADRMGSPMVWKIESDGSVRSVPIEIVKYETDHAIVRANLYQGDQLVSAGVQRIDADCRVRVWQD